VDNYGADCKTGSSYALAALRYMRDGDYPPLLGHAVISMIRNSGGSPNHNGIIIGFCAVIADAARAGSNETTLKLLEQHYLRD
jgi:hypothetical protein